MSICISNETCWGKLQIFTDRAWQGKTGELFRGGDGACIIKEDQYTLAWFFLPI